MNGQEKFFVTVERIGGLNPDKEVVTSVETPTLDQVAQAGNKTGEVLVAKDVKVERELGVEIVGGTIGAGLSTPLAAGDLAWNSFYPRFSGNLVSPPPSNAHYAASVGFGRTNVAGGSYPENPLAPDDAWLLIVSTASGADMFMGPKTPLPGPLDHGGIYELRWAWSAASGWAGATGKNASVVANNVTADKITAMESVATRGDVSSAICGWMQNAVLEEPL